MKIQDNDCFDFIDWETHFEMSSLKILRRQRQSNDFALISLYDWNFRITAATSQFSGELIIIAKEAHAHDKYSNYCIVNNEDEIFSRNNSEEGTIISGFLCILAKIFCHRQIVLVCVSMSICIYIHILIKTQVGAYRNVVTYL